MAKMPDIALSDLSFLVKPAVKGVLGGILSVVLSQLIVGTYKIRRGWGLRGNWMSQWKKHSEKVWTDEKITIGFRPWGLVVKGKGKERVWSGSAKIQKNAFLAFEGKSDKAAAVSEGVAMLCIGPQGDTLHGYWMGGGEGGTWILARKVERLAHAKINV